MKNIKLLFFSTICIYSCTTEPNIESYIEEIREINATHPTEEVVIRIPAGEYKLDHAIVLDSIENLTIEGEPQAATILTGAKEIKHWKKDTEREGVLVADVSDICNLGVAGGSPDRIDLYCDGKRQTLARWPNAGFTHAGTAIGATTLPETWISKHGTKEGVFEYIDSRINQWEKEKDVFLHGYWYWDWAEESQHLGQLDTIKHVISVKEPYHKYGYRDELRFYGYNLLCELDSVSEYYIDRETKKIYWKPCDGYLPKESRTTLSVFGEPVALTLRNCKHVTLRNITLNGVRCKGLQVEGGEDVTIENCRFTAIGDDAIVLDNGWRHRITGCLLSELAQGGITAKGGNRKTLEPSGFVISDNVVENFSLYKRTYAPAILFHGAGIDITHNRFQGSSSSAMRLEGNDINVEYNQCFDLVRESDDQGGIDSFFDFSYRRINVRHNHWRNIVGGSFAGAAGVRFDDVISGHYVVGNVFENCGGGLFGAVQINGGKDNTIDGNVFYNCQAAASCTVWSEEGWEKNFNNDGHKKRLEDVGWPNAIYMEKYPELREPHASSICRNYLTNNIVVNAKKLAMMGEDHFVCENNTQLQTSDKSLDYFLNPDVLSSYGIPAIPFDEIGPRNEIYSFGQ